MSPRRRAVLGLDAAWTDRQPSGIALLVETARGWRCAGLAPSYAAFHALAEGRPADWRERPRGGPPDPAALLATAARLAPGAALAVIAADLPLARTPIVGRRPADDAVSRAFGARGCVVHSPSQARPGPLSDRLRAALDAQGFALATALPPAPRVLLEVYPHTALLALLDLDYRLPYKVSRARRYWPEADPAARAARLLEMHRRILGALRREVGDLDVPLPAAARSAGALKRFEDALDALLCAWVGIAYLTGRAEPFGDRDAAVWCPRAGTR